MTDKSDMDSPESSPSDGARTVARVSRETLKDAVSELLPGIIALSDKAQAAIAEAFRKGEAAKAVQKLVAESVEESIKNALERRFQKLEAKLDKKISDASSTIMATLRGGIEGKVLAALTTATHSKEFRDLLQEITIFSAQHALKDTAGPLFDRLREDFKATLSGSLDKTIADVEGRLESLVSGEIRKFAGHADFDEAVSKALSRVFAETARPALDGLAGDLKREASGMAAEECRKVMSEAEQRFAGKAETVAASVEDLKSKLGILFNKTEELDGALEAGVKDAIERTERLNEALSGLDDHMNRMAKDALGEGSGETIESRMRKIAGEAVNLAWEQRALPQIAEIARKSEEAGGRLVKDMIANEMFVEKVRIIASDERKESSAETEALVRKTVLESGAGGEGVPRGLIENLASEAVSNSLKDIKSIMKRIEPLVKEKMDEFARERGGAVADAEQVKAIVDAAIDNRIGDRLTAGTEIEKRIEDLKSEIKQSAKSAVREYAGRELTDMASKMAGAPEVKKAIKDSISGELVETAILERAIQSFLATDEVKEMIDDRFRTIRMFLKNEEIPRIVNQILKETRPNPQE